MSLIQVEHLTFSYPGSSDPVFEDVSFHLDTDWKLGFVGRNGRGKTTFLRLLLGRYPYQGRITASVQFDYFPYEVEDPAAPVEQMLQQVAPEAEPWRLRRELFSLGMAEEVLERPFETLSYGERTKVLLAALFLKEGHFLLIDEPTNHLDLETRAAVSAYLRKKPGFLLVSHDRSFLDGCVDHILSLNRAGIQVQSGNFSSYFENFSNQQSFEQAQNDRLQKEARRLRQSAGRSAGWSDQIERTKTSAADSGYVGHKSAKMMKRAKSIEARRRRALEETEQLLKNTEAAPQVQLHPQRYHSPVLARLDGVSIRYGQRAVCPPVSFELRQGDRVVLEGRNGSGKSSLLKLLLGKPLDHTGLVRVGSGLVISYVPQDAGDLRGSLRTFARERGLEESLFLTLLRKLGLSRTQFERDLWDFSGGQKKKVLLAESLCRRAHLYVWDEPLNYIDLYSRIQLEQMIIESKPTMVLVEHDQAFRQAVGTKFISL